MPAEPSEQGEEHLAELVDRFLGRLRAGDHVSATEFAAEHPEGGAELVELLEALAKMEDLGQSSHPPVTAPIDYPKILGDYEMVEKIGSGGMGTVFRAFQRTLRREVAVKLLSPSWSADTRHSEAFDNESRLIARLRHTNIVEVFGAGQEGPWRYYVMGLVRGQGVRAGNLPSAFPGVPYEQAVARVGLQAADALAFAHSHGVLHRDVKPGNLLLDAEGVVHVSDFGLATVLNAGEEAPLVTQTHDGTLRYMAPERLMRGENSFAGDQYSLGLTLYELLSRRAAFAHCEPGELVHRICHEPIPPLRHAGELGAIINKAISFRPSDRYPSMAAMADDLRRFLDGEPVQARPASQWRRYIMWMKRRPAVAAWSHAAALLLIMLFTSMIVGYARVRTLWHAENEQRLLAERNEQIADASLQRIFTSMVGTGEGDEGFLPPTRADVRLIQDLMPYYEQILSSAPKRASTKMAEACAILAHIALKTGDFTMAETYYRRAAEDFPHDSASRIAAMNGLAASLHAQEDAHGGRPRLHEANALLLRMVEELSGKELTPEAREELVRSLMLAARHSAPCSCGEQIQCSHEVPGRGALLARAATLLAGIVPRDTDNIKLQLLRAELLAFVHDSALRRMLSSDGEDSVEIVEKLLKEKPDSDEIRRMYVRLAMRHTVPGEHKADLPRAMEYAQQILADNPGDSEAILLFFALRDRSIGALRRAGEEAQAAREGERTLGVLSLLTSRSDFSQDIRERLIMFVAMRPAHESDFQHREAELRTLLKDYDDGRIQNLRHRMQQLRRRFPRPQKDIIPKIPFSTVRKREPGGDTP